MVLTKKHPSPDVKPANQLGSLILQSKTLGLGTGIIFGKAASIAEGRPLIHRGPNSYNFA